MSSKYAMQLICIAMYFVNSKLYIYIIRVNYTVCKKLNLNPHVLHILCGYLVIYSCETSAKSPMLA